MCRRERSPASNSSSSVSSSSEPMATRGSSMAAAGSSIPRIQAGARSSWMRPACGRPPKLLVLRPAQPHFRGGPFGRASLAFVSWPWDCTEPAIGALAGGGHRGLPCPLPFTVRASRRRRTAAGRTRRSGIRRYPAHGLAAWPDRHRPCRRCAGPASASRRTGADLCMWQMSLFANPYAALCADVGPPTKAEWTHYAPGEAQPSACR